MTTANNIDAGRFGADSPKLDPKGSQLKPEELFEAGLFYMQRNRINEALEYFSRAMHENSLEPRYISYAGMCHALEGRTREALELCEKAVKMDFSNADLYLNLGRVYLLSGDKRKAHQTLWKGRDLDNSNEELFEELNNMGLRKPPIFKSLPRGHWINKSLGKLLYKLHLR